MLVVLQHDSCFNTIMQTDILLASKRIRKKPVLHLQRMAAHVRLAYYAGIMLDSYVDLHVLCCLFFRYNFLMPI